ncbi:AbrB/MazE/SpoVT family DNA-binding domain-containing protein [Halorubrum trapanicum]|uniref:AbrB/MazE/SpoVT family DNA-binding domain-containing protein n=1 Tax=Halorubrum trapanicum TaxID=29284 RepID=UPI001AEAD35B|nr:AbrB/MazE/SpoVT family DNA-binding domain-containing protein [Halorubrum trapanicum]
MPRVTVDGRVTIPESIRRELGIEPGDKVVFERVDSEYRLRKRGIGTEAPEDPFEKYRGSARSDDRTPDRMRRLRDEYPRDVDRTSTGNEFPDTDGT